VQDEMRGVLFFNYHERRHTFTLQEVAFAQRLSASLGLAIANAQLYETEHHIADRLQEALLALPDAVAGVEFAHSYHSAAEAGRVGGDFYDLFELDGGHVGVVVGDVAGKGLDAAVLTSLVKNTVRAHAAEKGCVPGRILDLTNDVVFKATNLEAFVTLFFGVIDTDGRLVYANAGHTTAAVIRTDGTTEGLPATGPLLGAFDGVTFRQAETSLGRDATLFLYTDGLTEARRDGDLYGEERLFALLPSLRGLSAEDVVAGVMGDVTGYSGAELRDDLAVLALRLSAPSAEGRGA
jgi:serine phosphatase RsbU (regulator of sigma subunit)